MNKKIFTFFVVGLALLVTPSVALAKSGPTGLNNIRTEAGPGAGQITINWQRFYSDVTGYQIQYGTTPGKYQYGTGKLGNIATYTIGSLAPGKTYYFRLYPYRNGVLSDSASPEFSDVAMSTPSTVIGTAGPYGQRGLTASQGPAMGEVTLTWHKIYPDVNNYHVTYGLQPGKYIYGAQNVGDAVNGVKSFTVGHLKSGTRYYFAITPSRGGQSLYDSAEVSQVAP